MTKPKKDSMGTRFKRYERASQVYLPVRSSVIIRVDGKSFHTWTKQQKCTRPFDGRLINTMTRAAQEVSWDMGGFKLAYTQSDEASFLLTDFDTLTTEGWFDYNLSKLVSVTASMFTAQFNQYWGPNNNNPAFFDARAFIVPEDDVANYFLWRQKDWVRNSVQMLAQAHFSPKQLHGKKQADMHDMLHEKGINWAELHEQQKNGAYLTPSIRTDIQPIYSTVQGLIDEAMGRTL